MRPVARERSPFPGMDPWLEDPRGWRGVHARFVTYLCDAIAERLPGRYYARLEDRVYLDAEEPGAYSPDARVVERPGIRRGGGSTVEDADPVVVISVRPEEVQETFIEIRDSASGHHVVTVIELLSPTNKRPPDSEGARSYRKKQDEVLASDANLVEIDLLRGGEHVVAVPRDAARRRCGAYHYLVVFRRAARPEHREVCAVRLPSRLPRIAVPLRAGDADVVVDLQPILDRVYAMGAYGSTLDYDRPPVPPLDEEDARWARSVIEGPA